MVALKAGEDSEKISETIQDLRCVYVLWFS